MWVFFRRSDPDPFFSRRSDPVFSRRSDRAFSKRSDPDPVFSEVGSGSSFLAGRIRIRLFLEGRIRFFLEGRFRFFSRRWFLHPVKTSTLIRNPSELQNSICWDKLLCLTGRMFNNLQNKLQHVSRILSF